MPKRIDKVPAQFRKAVETKLEELTSFLHDRREKLGLSQEELAEELEVAAATVQFWEQRRRQPSLPMLFYLCEFLGVELSWREELQVLDDNDPRLKGQKNKTYLPLMSLDAVATGFGEAKEVEHEGWVYVGHRRRKVREGMFVARVKGRSMETSLKETSFPNESLAVFAPNPEGPKGGMVVLAQFRGLADPETGGAYTLKEYHSEKAVRADGFRHKRIVLKPRNKSFREIVVPESADGSFKVIAKFLFVV